MKRMKYLAVAAAIFSMTVLAACGGEGEGGGLNEVPPTSSVPTVAVISPEELAQKSAESSGYALKVMAVEDPASAASSYTAEPDTRLMAVQVELENVSSDDAMPVDIANAIVTDDKDITYNAVSAAREGEIAAGDLKKGDKSSGWLAFQVPKDAKLKSITYRVGLISIIALTADLPQK